MLCASYCHKACEICVLTSIIELAKHGHTGAGALLLSGACGGIAFWCVALPFDAIKSHLQTDTTSKSNLAAIRTLLVDKGPSQLYRGMGVALTRGIPGAAIVFLVQRKSHDILDKLFPPSWNAKLL